MILLALYILAAMWQGTQCSLLQLQATFGTLGPKGSLWPTLRKKTEPSVKQLQKSEFCQQPA